MSGSDNSVWLLTIVGTLAGVVGAAAATIQVVQARQRRSSNDTTPSVEPPTKRSKTRTHMPRSRRSAIVEANETNENVVFILSFALAAIFFELLAWLAFAILDIHPRTIPAYVLFALPALMAIASAFLQFVQIPFAIGDILESDGGLGGLYIIIGLILTFILDTSVILLSIKLAR